MSENINLVLLIEIEKRNKDTETKRRRLDGLHRDSVENKGIPKHFSIVRSLCNGRNDIWRSDVRDKHLINVHYG